MAVNNDFVETTLKSNQFSTLSFARYNDLSEQTLIVYIEGDGHAWEQRKQISNDPTPGVLVTFNLTVQDPSNNILYLSRPCQFVLRDNINCDPIYWSSHCYPQAVINYLIT